MVYGGSLLCAKNMNSCDLQIPCALIMTKNQFSYKSI